MKLLVTGAWNGAQSHFSELRQLGHEIIWMPDERGILPPGSCDAEGVICNGLFLHHSLDRFPLLRFIQLTSAGFDRAPMDEIRRREIALFNARGVYSIPMAEFALCGVLQLYKQSLYFRRNQDLCRWEKHRGLLELHGRTVCILGIGSVGTECAVRFKAFGCKILGVDIDPRPNASFDEVFSLDALDQVLAMSDVAVLSLPLTDQTRHLMDCERLRAMKPGAILVNLARGAIVDTAALTDSLSNHLGGAVLDVFEEEPLRPDSPLWSMEHVLMTPHNSFVGDGNSDRLYQIILDNLEHFS